MKLGKLIKKLEEIKSQKGEDIDVGVLIEVESHDHEDGTTHSHLSVFYTMLDSAEELTPEDEKKKDVYMGFYCQPVLEVIEEDDDIE